MINERKGLAPIPESWQEPLTQWEQYLISNGRTMRTVDTRIRAMRRFARNVNKDPGKLCSQDLINWSASQDWKPETRHSYHETLRQFFTWSCTIGLIKSDLAKALPPVKRPAPAPRPTPETIYTNALESDERTALIIMLAGRLGLRRAEIAQVNASDLTPDLIGYSLLVHGKGGVNRLVPLPDDLVPILKKAFETGAGWAFPGNYDGHLSPAWVGKLGSRALEGLWTTHSLRHRFASVVYAKTHDLRAVQTILGHTSPATTQRYIYVPTESLRQAVMTAS